MWSNRLVRACLLAVFCLGAECEAGPAVTCPGTTSEAGHVAALVDARLYFGPPANLLEQIGDADKGQWQLSLLQTQAKEERTHLYLVCRYAHTKSTVTLELPAGARKCVVSLTRAGKTSASCV